jgi:putative NADH-flavin reductase
MKIALFGASGTIGQRIALEALVRGYEVKVLARRPEGFPIAHPRLSVAKVDIFDAASVADAVVDVDVVVNATGDRGVETAHTFFINSTKAVVEGVKRAGNKRLIVVGGAGSLEVDGGVQLVDTPAIPQEWRHIPLAQREALFILRDSDSDWTFFSPSAEIAPGRRTGKYRLGKDQLLTNGHGESYISAEDYAIALVDEIEQKQFVRQRFTAVSLER